jgi:hypothetical protein
MKTISCLLAAIALLCGCLKQTPIAPPSKIETFRTEAQQQLGSAVSNYVVGVTRIVHTDLNCTSEVVSNWSATATVEFVNKNGGVERKDVPFVFVVVNGTNSTEHIYCMEDEPQIFKAAMDAASRPR